MRLNGIDKQHLLPSLVLLSVGLLCIWASQASAEQRGSAGEAIELQKRTQGTALQLENSCDHMKRLRNSELISILENKVDAVCKQVPCTVSGVPFYSKLVWITRGKVESSSDDPYQFHYSGQPLTRQQLVDESLGYPCNVMHTHEDPMALYSYKPTENDEVVTDALSAISEARRKMASAEDAGAITGKTVKARVTGSQIIHDNSDPAALRYDNVPAH